MVFKKPNEEQILLRCIDIDIERSTEQPVGYLGGVRESRRR